MGKKKGVATSKATVGGAALSKAEASEVKAVMEDERLAAEEKARAMRDRFVEAAKRANGLEAALAKAAKLAEVKAAEAERAIKMKKTLEKLCRELQDQNQNLLNASRHAAEAEAAQREAANAKFQAAIDEVSRKIEAQSAVEKTSLELQAHLKDMDARVKLSEEHHAKQLEAKEIEIKLVKAKADQQLEVLGQRVKEATVRAQLMDKLSEENKSLHATTAAYKEQFDALSETMKKSEALYYY